MKIRMTVEVSGTRSNGQEWPRRGGFIEVGDQEGADLCAAGIATPVVDDAVETADAPQPEKRSPGRSRKQA